MTKRHRPYLVTGAAVSRVEEHRSRQRRYFLTMAARVVLLVLACVLARYSMLLAICIAALSTVLPWIAVVMANDGPPKSSKRNRSVVPDSGHERALTTGTQPPPERRVITAGTVVIDENGATQHTEE